MTIRTLRSTLLIAGLALASTMALAENEHATYDREGQGQGLQNPGSPGPDVTGDQGRLTDRRAAEDAMVSAVMPTSGPVGTLVTIKGTHLSGVTKVQFSPIRDASFKVVSDTEIQVTVPDEALPGPIQLATPNGVVQSPMSFLVAYQ